MLQANMQPSGASPAEEESKESIYALMGGGGGGAAQPESAAASQVVSEHSVGIASESNFLIVDLRDKAEYIAWHIKESYSLPLMLVNQDKTIPEVHRFKNIEGKRIVCYVSDERNGISAARALVDRGYDNTFLLTGGIEKFIEDYPSLVEGNNIPQLVDKTPAAQSRRR